jgi:hypothetical protein
MRSNVQNLVPTTAISSGSSSGSLLPILSLAAFSTNFSIIGRAVLNSVLSTAVNSTNSKILWSHVFINAMGATRRIRIVRDGVTQRTATLTGTMTVDDQGRVTNFGRLSNVTGTATCNFSDGAVWELTVEGGNSYDTACTWTPLGTTNTIVRMNNIPLNGKAFGLSPSFALSPPAALSLSGPTNTANLSRTLNSLIFSSTVAGPNTRIGTLTKTLNNLSVSSTITL